MKIYNSADLEGVTVHRRNAAIPQRPDYGWERP
jgi:hypothetical protein